MPQRRLTVAGTGLRSPSLGAGTAVAGRTKQSPAERTLWIVTLVEAFGYSVLAITAFIMALIWPHKYDADSYWTPQLWLGTWVPTLVFVTAIKLAWLVFAMCAGMAVVRILQAFGWMRISAAEMISKGRNPMRCYLHGIFVGGLAFVIYFVGAGSHIIEASGVWVTYFLYWVEIAASEKLNPPARGTAGTNTVTDWSVFIGATLAAMFSTGTTLANFGRAIAESSGDVPIWAYIAVFGFFALGLIAWIVNALNLAFIWFRSYYVVEYAHRIWSFVVFVLVTLTLLVGALFEN